MRKAAPPSLLLALALIGVRASAEEIQWRAAAAVPQTPPPVSLGRPVALDNAPANTAGLEVPDRQLRPISYVDVSLSPPQPILRGQLPDNPAAPGVPPPPIPPPYPPSAQPGPPPGVAPVAPVLPPPPGAPGAPPVCAPAAPCCPKQQFFVSTEFLMWWVSAGKVPTLVTTQMPGGPVTTVLGDQHAQYGLIPGFRMTADYWFSPEQCWGIDGGFFVLGQGAKHYSISPTDAANITIGNNTLNLPGVATASAQASSLTSLWGADVNALWRVYKNDCLTIDLLGGFRFLQLEESLNLSTTVTAVPGMSFFDGVTGVNNVTQLTAFDGIKTRNQFYGGQLGARMEYRFGKWSVDLLSKVALGSTNETRLLSAAITDRGPFGTVTTGTGALIGNPGHTGHSDISFVSDTALSVSYRFNNYIRAFAGYDFLFWSAVARPGDQTPTLTAPMRTTTFWAQGVNLGLAFTF